MSYYLLDLERTISRGKPYFWLKNKHGYTSEIGVAGLFAKEAAEEIIDGDFSNTTIMIHINKVAEILQLEVKNV